ncbi:MAG: menaquinone biosynthetic enzyme MqnA/MqnD family protein [Bacteroidota bacterium]
MTKISVVSYLNSKPFIYGLKKTNFHKQAEVELDIPSVCAEKLLTGKVDIGLVPVAVLPDLKKYTIISDYCIGANGPVDSVLLLSNVPLKDIKTILLDYQSRTSVLLTRILAKRYWEISPDFISSAPGYEKEITGDIAGVVIGDRALQLKDKFKFCYDLSGEWKNFTSLPFVFATWTAINPPDEKFLNGFNNALSEGMKLFREISQNESSELLSEKTIYNYLTNSIDYNFDEQKKNALDLFLRFASDFR